MSTARRLSPVWLIAPMAVTFAVVALIAWLVHGTDVGSPAGDVTTPAALPLLSVAGRQPRTVQGVGITVRGIEAGLRVQRVLEDSPAARAGIRRADVVVAADGHPLAGRSTDAASALIKGLAGTRVRLRIRRGGRTLTKDVERAATGPACHRHDAARAACCQVLPARATVG